KVNPGGASTNAHFEWGTTTGYGTTGSTHAVGSGIGDVALSELILPGGLKGQTTYHYRLVAENSAGKVVGADQSFTTPDWRPKAVTEAQTGLAVVADEGKVTLHGKVSPNTVSTHYRFEWGTKAEYEKGEYNHLSPVPDASVGAGATDVSVQQT